MKTIDTFVSWEKSRPSLSSNSFCFSLKVGSWWSGLVKFKDLTSGHVSSSGANSGFRPNVGWGFLLQLEKLSFSEGCPCCTHDLPQDQRHKRAPPRGWLVIPHLKCGRKRKEISIGFPVSCTSDQWLERIKRYVRQDATRETRALPGKPIL